jgi:hypothetical protein
MQARKAINHHHNIRRKMAEVFAFVRGFPLLAVTADLFGQAD